MDPSSLLTPTLRDSGTRLWQYVFGLFLILSWVPDAWGANTFSPTGSLGQACQPTLVLLPNGKVLVAGGLGYSGGFPGQGLDRCELFDPATGQWSPTGSLVAETTRGGRRGAK